MQSWCLVSERGTWGVRSWHLVSERGTRLTGVHTELFSGEKLSKTLRLHVLYCWVSLLV